MFVYEYLVETIYAVHSVHDAAVKCTLLTCSESRHAQRTTYIGSDIETEVQY